MHVHAVKKLPLPAFLRHYLELCSCGHKIVEQVAGGLTNGRVVILPVQVVAEDIFIWTAPCRNILTYLLILISLHMQQFQT